MEKSKASGTGFIVYDFMVDKLRLSGVSLLIYALIYSFYSAEGCFYGSVDYMAERVGATTSSVKRVLATLMERKLIIKDSDNQFRTKIYRINPKPIKGWLVDTGQNASAQNEPLTGLLSAPEGPKIGPNNKLIIKQTTTPLLISSKSEEMPFYLFLGESGRVMMTMDQYGDLVKRFGRETVKYYIERIEDSLISRPEVRLINHYKTILKWAMEDAVIL